jgi:hypothetical protein
VSRKLLLLDVVLVAIVAFAGFQLRAEWRAAKAREAARLNVTVPPVPPPAITPLPMAPPVLPAGYADIAQKDLFDRSRNPNVVVEVAAPPPPPPPPPLPVYHGMMNLGPGGPLAIFSVNAGSPHQAVHPGEQIAQYKLLEVTGDGFTLEWNGQKFHKTAEELANRAAPPAAVDAADGRTAAPPPPTAAPPPTLKGPGEDTGRGFKICAMNDGQADGAVVDGYRKVVYTTPFGQACRYEPVR